MKTNAQSISEIAPAASPQIAAHERQPSLSVGPTGVVHRGAGPAPWHKRLALTKAPSSTAHHVLLVLGSFVSDGESDAWPSLTTLASMTGLSDRAVRKALRALEGANLVTTEHVSGRSSRYRLSSTPEPRSGVPRNLVPPTPEPRSPKVRTREGTSTRKAAAAAISSTDTEKPKAETVRPDRHTCLSCGNTWPGSYDTTCHKCGRKVGSRHPAGLAAPEPGKYDDLEQAPRPDPEPRPDPPPMKPELRRDLEADALRAGLRKVGGLWTRAGLACHLRGSASA